MNRYCYVKVGVYSVEIKPTRLRRIVLDLYPYFQGAKPRFEITLFNDSVSDEPRHEYVLFYKYSNGEMDEAVSLGIQPLKRNKTSHFDLDITRLKYTGDTTIIAYDAFDKKEIPVYVFHTTARTWLFLTLIAGLLAGLISLLGELLVRCN